MYINKFLHCELSKQSISVLSNALKRSKCLNDFYQRAGAMPDLNSLLYINCVTPPLSLYWWETQRDKRT